MEEKEVKGAYRRDSYKNISEKDKQRLKDYPKKNQEARKTFFFL